MQLEVKTILNRIQHFAGFVYQEVRLRTPRGKLRIEVRIEPHRGLRGKCSECRRPAPGYDRLPERWWLFVPLWGIVTWFLYAPRRVECPEHGVVVEHIPWSEGKRPITTAMMGFLARWARHLSWRQTARSFQTSWEAVYRSLRLLTWTVRPSSGDEEATNWRPVALELSDATGNHWRVWLDSRLASVNGFEVVVGFFGALWPGEDAWKMRAEFKRSGGFPEEERLRVEPSLYPSRSRYSNPTWSTS
jgi:hypothetical protein